MGRRTNQPATGPQTFFPLHLDGELAADLESYHQMFGTGTVTETIRELLKMGLASTPTHGAARYHADAAYKAVYRTGLKELALWAEEFKAKVSLMVFEEENTVVETQPKVGSNG